MDGDSVHPSFQVFIDQMSADTPIFRKCPYSGRIEFLNFSVKGDGPFAIYPAGMYKIGITMSRKKNKVDLIVLTAVYSFRMEKSG